MFGISVGISVLFVLWGLFFTESLTAVGSAVLGFLIDDFGWVFILSTFGFLLFVGYLAPSRYGKIKLGPDDDVPEFNTVSWVAMMFSVGMGIGLMFYGVAKPISHFSAPPFVLVMIGLCYSLFKELRTEPLLAPRGAPEPARAATRPTGAAAPQQFRAERDSGER